MRTGISRIIVVINHVTKGSVETRVKC
jgi:hypothetical protein